MIGSAALVHPLRQLPNFCGLKSVMKLLKVSGMLLCSLHHSSAGVAVLI